MNSLLADDPDAFFRRDRPSCRHRLSRAMTSIKSRGRQQKMTVLIAGGGIGGLTLALSLHQIGVPCRVFESVSALRPLGVGINVLPHAVRELIELGLHDQLDASGVRTRELAFFSKHGKPIWSEPRGIEAGYKWPQFSIHRGRLQQILLDTAIERLGAENILTSHHLSGWTETPDGVRADFIDKATGKPAGSHDGTLLIAADGIHSAIRQKLYPQEGAPLWNGRILWRGITRSDAFLSGRTMIMAGHEILKFVCYPISQEPDADGKYDINWVAERHMPPTYEWRREDYNRSARLEEFLPWFKDWTFDWLDVPGLISNCPHAYEYPLVDRDPVDRWTFGRVTLMGDAAHPMYPIGSNGASQAILDARVLTREILALGDVPAALEAYEAERRPATTDLVMLNRRNGPEQVMQIVEERAPEGFDVVTDVLSQQELEDIAANYKRVAGFQVEGLNAKPPIVQLPVAARRAGVI
jgi:2-polyprenyl-6-methoxyphenol hydroxylase-like FAD-dependent oxidoreductase